MEFALVAPVFLLIVLAVSETSTLFSTKTQMAFAVREGARLAGMDRDGLLEPGESLNDKIIGDVRHFLVSNGLPGDAATVRIVSPDDHCTPLDLDDPVNEWALFELLLELPYSAVTHWYDAIGGSNTLTTSVVFRNGRPRPMGGTG